MESQNVRILIAEDHKMVREAIRMLVSAQPDMEVIGEADDGEIALAEAVRLNPDLVLLDISMPNMNGLHATKALRRKLPSVKILTLTRHEDDGFLRQLINAGSNGYVLKQSAPTELISAIRVVSSGQSYLDPSLTAKVMGQFAGRVASPRGETYADLTERENDVLRLIAFGYSNKEIGNKMEVSVKTIESHKSNAMRKLGITSRIDVVKYAILQDWLHDN